MEMESPTTSSCGSAVLFGAGGAPHELGDAGLHTRLVQ